MTAGENGNVYGTVWFKYVLLEVNGMKLCFWYRKIKPLIFHSKQEAYRKVLKREEAVTWHHSDAWNIAGSFYEYVTTTYLLRRNASCFSFCRISRRSAWYFLSRIPTDDYGGMVTGWHGTESCIHGSFWSRTAKLRLLQVFKVLSFISSTLALQNHPKAVMMNSVHWLLRTTRWDAPIQTGGQKYFPAISVIFWCLYYQNVL